MNGISKWASAATLALALTLPLATPVSAGDKSGDIVVRSQADMKSWKQAKARELNRLLARAPVAKLHTPNETIVQVAFTIDAAGNPQDIEVIDGNANFRARSAAVYAVKRLSGLADAPVTNVENAKFLANLIFADSPESHRKLAAKLDERARLANLDDEGEFILLGG